MLQTNIPPLALIPDDYIQCYRFKLCRCIIKYTKAQRWKLKCAQIDLFSESILLYQNESGKAWFNVHKSKGQRIEWIRSIVHLFVHKSKLFGNQNEFILGKTRQVTIFLRRMPEMFKLVVIRRLSLPLLTAGLFFSIKRKFPSSTDYVRLATVVRTTLIIYECSIVITGTFI